MRLTPILALALLLPLASNAAPAMQENALAACGALSQADMRACMSRKAADSQALLQHAEAEVLAALGKWDEDARYAQRAKQELGSSGKAFERYRETQCAFASALGGGAIASALELRRLACVIALNQERAAALANSIVDLPRR